MQPATPALTRCGSPSPPPARPSAAASATPDAFPPLLLDELAADLAAQITWHRHLVPARPGRRYERKTKRPGGRYKTRKTAPEARMQLGNGDAATRPSLLRSRAGKDA